MLSHYWMMFLMILVSIWLAYYVNAVISLRKYTTDNLNKFYMAVFMGLQMGLIELLFFVLLLGGKITNVTIIIFITLVIGIVFIGYKLYTLDFMRDDEQFMLAMIEHHSMALSMADKNQTQNPRLKKIIADIKASQEAQIKEMYDILQKNH